jgi:ribosomal protein S18 acetylase RimI-like enzyme
MMPDALFSGENVNPSFQVRMIRHATLNDLDALVAIENQAFATDHFPRRVFRYLLTRANAVTLVHEQDGALQGYAVTLFNTGTSLARLYSMAVVPGFRGRSVGSGLMHASETMALERDCVAIRIEVRKDNHDAIRLYRKKDYRQFDEVEDYYEDHMAALRFEKSLAPHLRFEQVRVPYYQQTLEFTCGASALMMAMKTLDPGLELDRMLELRIWREATTIFMTSGHGGCGPYGLALSAHHRGFGVELYINDTATPFVDSVRSPEKKEVIRLVQQDFINEVRQLKLPVHYGSLSLSQINAAFDQGAVPIVLISSYRIYREKFPHWVVVTGFDEKFIYVHDPFVDHEVGKSVTDCINMPILKKDFERMARYGRAGLKVIMLLRGKKRGRAGAAAKRSKTETKKG